MKIIYSNLVGSHVFENGKEIDKIIFKNLDEQISNSLLLEQYEVLESEKALLRKYPDAIFANKKKDKKQAGINEIREILSHFKGDCRLYRDASILIAKSKLRKSVSFDWLIIQCINHIEELNKIINILAKRLREWYELYNPEFSKKMHDHRRFANIIIKKTKEQLLREIGIKKEHAMGADLKKEDVDSILNLAKNLLSIYELKERQEKYLKKIMKENCPNITEVAGYLIGAKLIAISGSLERLATFPASTVQLLGAEKALFRHIRTMAKAPKHGIILQHQLLSAAKKEMRGKVARALADKISIAAKVDLFKGRFVGDKLVSELKKRFGGSKWQS